MHGLTILLICLTLLSLSALALTLYMASLWSFRLKVATVAMERIATDLENLMGFRTPLTRPNSFHDVGH